MTWRVTNVIEELYDGRQRERSLDDVELIAIHRVGVDLKLDLSLGKNGLEVAKQFIHNPEVAKYTGGQNPYTFIVDPNGKIWQCLPVAEVGNHARRWSVPGLGVAFYGDFRFEAPTDAQRALGGALCHHLVDRLGLTPRDIHGHTAVPGATSTPGKECPGRRFSLDAFRTEIAMDIGWRAYASPEDRQARMEAAAKKDFGIVWEF